MHISMYVYIYVYIYVYSCTYIFKYVCICVYTFLYVGVCDCVCMYACTYVRTYTYILMNMHIYISICICRYNLPSHTQKYARRTDSYWLCIHIDNTHTHELTRTHTHTHIHTHTISCTHTHTHTHTRTHTLAQLCTQIYKSQNPTFARRMWQHPLAPRSCCGAATTASRSEIATSRRAHYLQVCFNSLVGHEGFGRR